MSGEIVIPPGFAEKRRESNNFVLNNLSRQGVDLFGRGIDAGCFAGTSVGVLEKRGLGVTYVELDPRYASVVAAMGKTVVHADIIDYLQTVGQVDFVTFFGAPQQFSIDCAVAVARQKLTSGGSLIITGYSNINPQIDRALRYGGQRMNFQGLHDWDGVGYVYTR